MFFMSGQQYSNKKFVFAVSSSTFHFYGLKHLIHKRLQEWKMSGG